MDEYADDHVALDDQGGEDEEEPNCPEIRQLDADRFQMSFHVASAFFALIIGKKGATKKRIEGETRTRIVIPKQGAEGDVVVSGPSPASVRSAWSRLRLMVEGARGRSEFTHFLSLPLNAASMREALAGFRADCLEKLDGRARGVDASVFQDPGLLHLTIGTLSLMGKSHSVLLLVGH